jgi:hypothetical protein
LTAQTRSASSPAPSQIPKVNETGHPRRRVPDLRLGPAVAAKPKRGQLGWWDSAGLGTHEEPRQRRGRGGPARFTCARREATERGAGRGRGTPVGAHLPVRQGRAFVPAAAPTAGLRASSASAPPLPPAPVRERAGPAGRAATAALAQRPLLDAARWRTAPGQAEGGCHSHSDPRGWRQSLVFLWWSSLWSRQRL